MTERMTKKVTIGVLCAVFLVVLTFAAVFAFIPVSTGEANAVSYGDSDPVVPDSAKPLQISNTSDSTAKMTILYYDGYTYLEKRVINSSRKEVQGNYTYFYFSRQTIVNEFNNTSIKTQGYQYDGNITDYRLVNSDYTTRRHLSNADGELYDSLKGGSGYYIVRINVSKPKYTVTYDANTTDTVSGMPSGNATSIAQGSATTLPTVTRTGYTLSGWYTETSGGTKVGDGGASYTPTSNETLHAQWTPIAATAPTINGVTGKTVTYGYTSQSISVSASAASGHTITGYQWYDRGTTNGNSGGTIINGATSASYSFPTGKNAGTYYYYCVVTAKRSDNNQTKTATSGVVTVTVNRADISPSVTMSGWTYGGTASNPSVSGNSGSGTVTYQYKVSTAADSTYSSTKPSNAGTYTVKASVAQTTNYNAATATNNFTISRANLSLSVSMNGWTYGNAASNPSVSGNSGSGAVTYQYKVSTAADSTYTTTKPSNAGTYTVKATVAQTTNYNAGTATTNFTISKANLSHSVSMNNWTYGGTAGNPSVSGNSGSGTVTYNYKVSTAADSTYTTTKPTNAGTYTVKATVAQTTNYNAGTATKNFTINKASLTVAAKAKTVTYGDAPANNGVTYTGFVNNETNSVLGGTLAYSYSYSQYGNAGEYTITPSGYTSGNYTISYTTGTLTVIAKPITVTITPKSSVYGSAQVALSATDNGIVNNDTGVYTLSCDVTATTGVGSYAITGTDTSDNYDVTFAGESGAYTVMPKGVTVTAENKNKIYRDDDPVLTATAVGFVNGETEALISYILTRAAGENVGEYVITPSGAELQGNYSVSYVPATFTIGQRTVLNPTVILARSSYPYDAAQDSAPRATVKDGSVAISEDEYTLIYANNRNPASYDSANPPSVTVVDKVGGNYVLTFDPAENATVTFTIEPGQSYIEEVPKAVMGMIYNGNERELITAGTANNGTVKYRVGTTGEWSASVPTATAAGTYIVYYMVEGDVNYNDWNGGSENGQSLTVIIAPKTVTVVVEDKTKVYDNAAVTDPTLTAVITGVLEGETLDYTLTREAGQNAANYVISAVLGDNPNYDVQVTNGTFSVTKKPLTITADSDGKYYDGVALIKNTYQDTGVAAGDRIENVDVLGSQTVVGECANVPENALILCGETDVTANYDITYVSGLLTVDYATITGISVAQSEEMQYNGHDQKATVITNATTQGGQAVTFTYSTAVDGIYGSEVPAFSAVGEHTVYYIVSANEHGSESGSFVVTINRKDIAGATITLGERLIYTGEEQTQTIVSVTIDGLDVTYTVSGNVITAAGDYTLTVTGTNNFIGEVNMDFVVAQRDITIVVEAKSKTYGDPDPIWSANVLNNTGEDAIEYSLYREEGENVGEYAIRVDLGENAGYSIITVESVLTINPRAIDVAWSTEEFFYNGQEQAPTATATGLANGDEVLLTVTGGTDAGTHTATATFAVPQINYVLPVGTTVYSIAPKAVTVIIDGKTSVYGSERAPLTATDDGIVDGDVAYSLDCEVTATSAVCAYDITATDLSSNYSITFENEENAYTVTKKQITVTVDAKNRVYGDVDPALTYNASGLVNGDEIRGSLVRAAGESAGRYAIEKDNYDITYVGADFIIAKKPLSVIARDETILFGDDAPEYSAVIRGFVFDDDKSVLTGTLSLLCDYEKDDEIGTYAIVPRGLMSGNYEITFVAGTLTVKPAAISTEEVKVSIETEEGETEEGFDLNIALEVEVKTAVKAQEQEAAREELPVAANLGDRDLVAAIYNVKLIRTITENGTETTEEIQPEDIKPGTKITIAMKIPENLRNKSFRIIHVHSESDVEYVEDFTQDGDTVYVTVDKLSDFAFIINDTRVEFGGKRFSVVGFSLLWIILAILLALAIIIFIIYTKLENRKYGRWGR